MREFRVQVKGLQEICENTLLLKIERPSGFNFLAGQFVMIELPDLPKTSWGGNIRPMSIASSPDSEDLQIVFRKGVSDFKRHIAQLKPGDFVFIKGPYGIFTLENNKTKEIVFLAGGVGITPIRSMILDIFGKNFKEKNRKKIFLFYSNLRKETAAFWEEFEEIQKAHQDSFVFIPSISEPQDNDSWQGEKGFIREEMLKKYITDIKKPMYFIVGPPSFVEAMQKLLLGVGVKAGNIKIEKF